MNATLTYFIRRKIKDVEKAITAREQMARILCSGTNKSWAEAADFHPSTAGKRLTKAERKAQANIQDRILVKLCHELELYKQILEALHE